MTWASARLVIAPHSPGRSSVSRPYSDSHNFLPESAHFIAPNVWACFTAEFSISPRRDKRVWSHDPPNGSSLDRRTQAQRWRLPRLLKTSTDARFLSSSCWVMWPIRLTWGFVARAGLFLVMVRRSSLSQANLRTLDRVFPSRART